MKTAYENIKVGDKLYCTKTIIHLNTERYTKDKWYDIIEVNKNYIRILDNIHKSSEFLLFIPNDNEYKIYEYFYTQKEYRKQKLDKINQTR